MSDKDQRTAHDRLATLGELIVELQKEVVQLTLVLAPKETQEERAQRVQEAIALAEQEQDTSPQEVVARKITQIEIPADTPADQVVPAIRMGQFYAEELSGSEVEVRTESKVGVYNELLDAFVMPTVVATPESLEALDKEAASRHDVEKQPITQTDSRSVTLVTVPEVHTPADLKKVVDNLMPEIAEKTRLRSELSSAMLSIIGPASLLLKRFMSSEVYENGQGFIGFTALTSTSMARQILGRVKNARDMSQFPLAFVCDVGNDTNAIALRTEKGYLLRALAEEDFADFYACSEFDAIRLINQRPCSTDELVNTNTPASIRDLIASMNQWTRGADKTLRALPDVIEPITELPWEKDVVVEKEVEHQLAPVQAQPLAKEEDVSVMMLVGQVPGIDWADDPTDADQARHIYLISTQLPESAEHRVVNWAQQKVLTICRNMVPIAGPSCSLFGRYLSSNVYERGQGFISYIERTPLHIAQAMLDKVSSGTARIDLMPGAFVFNPTNTYNGDFLAVLTAFGYVVRALKRDAVCTWYPKDQTDSVKHLNRVVDNGTIRHIQIDNATDLEQVNNRLLLWNAAATDRFAILPTCLEPVTILPWTVSGEGDDVWFVQTPENTQASTTEKEVAPNMSPVEAKQPNPTIVLPADIDSLTAPSEQTFTEANREWLLNYAKQVIERVTGTAPSLLVHYLAPSLYAPGTGGIRASQPTSAKTAVDLWTAIVNHKRFTFTLPTFVSIGQHTGDVALSVNTDLGWVEFHLGKTVLTQRSPRNQPNQLIPTPSIRDWQEGRISDDEFYQQIQSLRTWTDAIEKSLAGMVAEQAEIDIEPIEL